MEHMEQKMGEFSSLHFLIDAHNDQADEVTRLKAKVADLEDRSRRNNVKICGVPITITPAQLREYACKLMKEYLPSTPNTKIVIDRIYQ